MPNIFSQRYAPFTAEPANLPSPTGRRATAADFGADIGAGLEALGTGGVRALTSYVDTVEADDAREVMVRMQEIRTQYQLQLADAETTGEDLQPISDKYTEEMDSVAVNAQTKTGLMIARDRTAENVAFLGATAERIHLARKGAKLKEDLVRSDAAAGQQLQSSPMMLPFLVQERAAILDTYRGIVPPTVLSALKIEGEQQLAIASAQALIEESPQLALNTLQNPEKDDVFAALTPDARNSLVNMAQTAVKAAKADAHNAWLEAKRAQDAADDAAMDSMLVDYSKGALNKWSMRGVMGQDGVSPDMKIRMGNVLEELRKPPPLPSHPGEFMRLYKGLAAGTETRTSVDKSLAGGNLNADEHGYLLAFIAREDRPQAQLERAFHSHMERLINPRDMFGRMLAPNGEMNAYKFMVQVDEVRKQFEAQEKDTTELFDPRSRVFEIHIAPLLQQYRAKSLIRYDDAAGTATMQEAPGSSRRSPYTVKEGEETTLDPGSYYRFPTDPAGGVRQRPVPLPPIGTEGKRSTGPEKRGSVTTTPVKPAESNIPGIVEPPLTPPKPRTYLPGQTAPFFPADKMEEIQRGILKKREGR